MTDCGVVIDMLRPMTPEGAPVPSPIYPDYNKSVEEIYTSIAYYFVENLPHLTVLSCVQDKHSRQLKSLPSWVPDFTSLSNEDLSFTSTANWNASKAGILQSYPRKLTGSTLELRGSCFDVIDDTVSVFVPPNWVGDGSRLPDGSVMSVHILGHFEKIIRFTCENKPWPYKLSRLEVLVATLVAGQLSAVPVKDDKESQDEQSSYFPSFIPSPNHLGDQTNDQSDKDSKPEEESAYFPSVLPASPKQLPVDKDAGLGITLSSLSPDWKSSPNRRGTSDSSPISPLKNELTRPKSASFGSSTQIVASPEPLSQEFSHQETPDASLPVTPKHKHSLNATEKFPYAKGVFQFRMWVLCMMIAGSLNETTEPMVSSCLGAISQLSFLCPPTIGHLPTRDEVAAAISATRSSKHSIKNMFQGIEAATGVGDFASGQFSEFDVRWSKTQGTQKMFRTKRGYFGMGPVSLEKGDQIWVVCDARVPFVLRPQKEEGKEGTFELLGETYLHGCMHGEMMTPEQVESIGPVSLV